MFSLIPVLTPKNPQPAGKTPSAWLSSQPPPDGWCPHSPHIRVAAPRALEADAKKQNGIPTPWSSLQQLQERHSAADIPPQSSSRQPGSRSLQPSPVSLVTASISPHTACSGCQTALLPSPPKRPHCVLCIPTPLAWTHRPSSDQAVCWVAFCSRCCHLV